MIKGLKRDQPHPAALLGLRAYHLYNLLVQANTTPLDVPQHPLAQLFKTISSYHISLTHPKVSLTSHKRYTI
jgi:hypothetical protein